MSETAMVVLEPGEITPERRVELESDLDAIADRVRSQWPERGLNLAKWLMMDAEAVKEAMPIQGVLFPEIEPDQAVYQFLVERCYYPPKMARFLIAFRAAVSKLPTLPFITPQMIEVLEDCPAQFLPSVLSKEETYIGKTYDQMPVIAKGSDQPSLKKWMKQLHDREALESKPAERLQARASSQDEDPADRMLRESTGADAQPKLINTSAERVTPGTVAIVGGASLFHHLEPVFTTWPEIQKEVVDDIFQGRVSKEQIADAYRFATFLHKVLGQYVA